MPIEVFDMIKMAKDEGKRKKIFNTNRFHCLAARVPQARRQR